MLTYPDLHCTLNLTCRGLPRRGVATCATLQLHLLFSCIATAEMALSHSLSISLLFSLSPSLMSFCHFGISQAHFSSCASFHIAAFCVTRLISFQKKDKQTLLYSLDSLYRFCLLDSYYNLISVVGKSRLGSFPFNFISSDTEMELVSFVCLRCVQFKFKINADLVFDILKLNFFG